MKILNYQDEIYHIHTERCGHATGSDRELIETCIECGMKVMTVTDHAPFPDDPFGNRMQYIELDEYLDTYAKLKQEYKDDIEIHTGLETEYFPQFEEYYQSLNRISELDAGLLLGQHMYYGNNAYSFTFDREYLKLHEYEGLGQAIVQGIESGYFRRVAHPDRIYRRYGCWDESCRKMAKMIIGAAIERGIPLEINLHSVERKQYRPEFWKLVAKEPDSIIYYAPDAHSVEDIREYTPRIEKFQKSRKAI